MSDIDFKIEWWEILLLSPLWGWPGLFVGAVAGAIVWKKRPILGGFLGALIGNFAFFFTRMLFM